MITTREQLDQQATDFEAGWPADEAPAAKAASSLPITSFFTADELEDRKRDEQQAAARKA